MKPVTATAVIILTLGIWNDFINPLLFLQKPHLQTVMLMVYNFVGERTYDWSVIFPLLVLVMIPVLVVYVMLQSFIIKGVTAGAVKE
jgi:raffinose/stachyose/melibiose transport system permease protein